MKTFFQSMNASAEKIQQAVQPAADAINRITKPIVGNGFARLVRVGNEARKTRPIKFGPAIPMPEKYTRGK